jgi:uncharacterized damage-inducible protein DinB
MESRDHSASSLAFGSRPPSFCDLYQMREPPMGYAESVLPEFDLEMATTRRVLERVPSDKGQWKPHEKSFALGHLAQLVAGMPGWITNVLTKADLDLASAAGYSYETTDTLLGIFDRHVVEARGAIAATTDDQLQLSWSLRRGDMVLWNASRGVVLRNHINHLIHHRGQLTVYLRLLNVPVPSIYGPSADEPLF